MCCLAITGAFAEILHVPGDFVSIQLALNALETGDTVLVAAGIYPEALTASPVSFVMRGVVEVGADPEKPVVDPSPLEGSTHLACLTLPGNSSAIIEDFIFRNGAEMYPRENSNAIGGISTGADELTLRRCLFDSTYKSLRPNAGLLVVDSCAFVDNVELSVWHLASTSLQISHSSFTGFTESGNLLRLTGNAVIDNCLFRIETGGEWIWIQGHGTTIRNCEFVPAVGDTAQHMLWIPGSGSGWTVENNRFHDLNMSGPVILYPILSVDDTCYLRNNEFHRIQATTPGGCAATFGGPNILADSNVFDSCFARSANGAGSLALANVNSSVFRSNRFIGPGIPRPNVRIMAQSDVQFRLNGFENTGWAIEASTYNLDADSNWWGDSTGPFHEQLNPEGFGDPVTGGVDFAPWLTENPFDSGAVATEPSPVLPTDLHIDVHPNPFNTAAALTLSVETPGAYTVTLYNTLGQRVTEIWTGRIATEKRIVFSGETLPSGIYFVTLVSAEKAKQKTMSKIVLLK